MGQLGNLSPGGSVAVGIIVGLISTSVQSLGLTLQRKSHILEDEKASHVARRPPHRRRRWQLGMGMFIISNLLGSTIQITTLPLPVLSTLQASGLVFNSICATLILGEAFTRWSLVGTVLVCTGAILIASFGAIPEPAHTLDELLELLGQRPFILWMIGQAFLVAGIIVCAKLTRVLIPRPNLSPRVRLLRGIAYGAVSGILSAHALLVAKSAVELLVRTIVDRVNQFNRWQSWMSLVGLLGLALTQLYYLHRGLKLCSTSVLYPLVFCIYNIIAILDGLIYFRQASKLPPIHAVLIAVGVVILLLGVFALSWRLNSPNEPTSQSIVATTPLAPNLTFVDSPVSPNFPSPRLVDEEGQTGLNGSATTHAAGTTLNHSATADPDPTTIPSPTTPIHRRSQRFQRPRRKTEAAEIWDELEDASTPSTPVTMRRTSTPAALQQARDQANERDRDSSRDGQDRVPDPTETTSLLHYRPRPSQDLNRNRRRSSHFPLSPSPTGLRRVTPARGPPRRRTTIGQRQTQDEEGRPWGLRSLWARFAPDRHRADSESGRDDTT
ncbi:MAG: hypothetical protein M1825_002600 [Sarcosagium campestre]|nr:MAG: hypothetical protein M1825_002600 [Sarcosagium campestre]